MLGKKVSSINQEMQYYIDSFHKESKRRETYPEQSTANFEDVTNINIDSASVISQEEKNGSEEDLHENPYYKIYTNMSIEKTHKRKKLSNHEGDN